MNRNTPVSWLAMTVKALRLTFSRAKADRTLANRPGLFSRKTEICLLFGMSAPSFRRNGWAPIWRPRLGAVAKRSTEQLRSPARSRNHSRRPASAVQSNSQKRLTFARARLYIEHRPKDG